VTDSAGLPFALKRTTILSRTREMPHSFQGSVVSISRCSHRGRGSFGTKSVAKKSLFRRAPSLRVANGFFL